MDSDRRSNRSRPLKSKKSNGDVSAKNYKHKHKYNKKKVRQDEICLQYLQFEKCNYAEKCNKAHLTLLSRNTKTTRLCKNIFPHGDELPYCQHMHINFPKHVIFDYLIKNQCTTCTAYNRKCPRIHEFEIRHLLRSEYKVDYDSSDDDINTDINVNTDIVTKSSAKDIISESKSDKLNLSDLEEMGAVFSFESSWADQVDEEELRNSSENVSKDN